MMRMWQLGNNIDIKEISENGKALFVLTVTGSEKIKNTFKERWLDLLICYNQQQMA